MTAPKVVPLASLSTGNDELGVDVGVSVGERAGAVDFELHVANPTDAAVSVANPYEMLTYQLARASDGTPVQGMPPAPSAKTHRRFDPAAKAGYLRVDGAQVGAHEVAGDDAVGAQAFEVAAGESLALRFSVGSLPGNDDRVPAGDYLLSVFVAVAVTADGVRRSATLGTTDGLAVTVS